MAVTFAIRFDSAKNAEIAAISQMSSSEKPWLATAAKSAFRNLVRLGAHLHREVEHGALARRDIRLAIVDAIWSAICGFFARMRRMAPCAITQ